MGGNAINPAELLVEEFPVSGQIGSWILHFLYPYHPLSSPPFFYPTK